MRAGKLDRRIVIQNKAEVIDAFGFRDLSWSIFLTVWSMPVQKDGKEQTTDNNRSTERPVYFRIRYNSTITNEMRVIWEGNYYKIEDIKELGRREGMILMTSKLAQT
jgi:SPP1 family predicted phage head-tail adaptor